MKFIEDLIAQYQPRLQELGARAVSYADVVTGQLSVIHDELRTSQCEYPRAYVNEIIPNGITPERVIDVPAGQVWVLEAWQMDDPANVNARLLFNGNFRANNGATGSANVSQPPIRFPGPGAISIVHAGAAPLGTFLQFRVIRARPMRSPTAGQIMAGVARYSAEREHAWEHSGLSVNGATPS